MRSWTALPLALLLLTDAHAQPSAARPGAQPAGGRAAAPTPLPPPAATSTASGPSEVPKPPSIDDPMLTPVPSPKRVVATWEETLGLVRSRSTDLKIAYDEVERAEAQSRIALAGTLPSLNGTLSATHQFLTNSATDPFTGRTVTSPTANVMNGNLTLVQPLFVPRIWYQMGTAHRAADAARLSVEDQKRNIALGVANAVLGVVTAERIAELNRVGLRNALERLDLTVRKKNLGAATGLDVLRAQQDAESARATLVNGDESLRQARESLGLALGFTEQVGVSPDIKLDGLEQSTTATCRAAQSLEERADIARARKNVEIAERGITDAKYQFSPTITAQSSLAATTADTGLSPNPTWNIQGVLSVPFWEGGARYGALRTARVQADEAEQQLVAARRAAEVQLAQAQRGVDVAAQARTVAATARDLAAQSDKLTRTGYLEGQGTSLELVVAASALREAEINLALRDFDLVRARILAILAMANCSW